MAAGLRAVELAPGTLPGEGGDSGRLELTDRLERIFIELAEIRALMNNPDEVEPEVEPTADPEELWAGLAAIQQAINQTRSEISSLHVNGLRDRQINRATDELDAVVSDTEHATQSILSAAESIDGASDLLATRLERNERARATEIHDNVIRIFEACNFQDIAGQRLSKVVALLHFIETSIGKMAEIWVDTSLPIEVDGPAKSESDALLNGPALAGDQGVVSQDDIDSLFN